MKRFCAFLLPVLLLVTLTACGKRGGTVLPITGGFSARVAIAYGEQSLEGKLDVGDDGGLTLAFSAPKTLAGITLGWNGEQMTVQMGDVTVDVDPERVPESALMKSLLEVSNDVRALMQGEGLPNGYAVSRTVDGMTYTLTFDPDSGFPSSLVVPDQQLNATFTEVVKFVSETT